mgnify:CR=1 FL=1
MIDKLRIVKQRYDEVSDLIIQPEIIMDQKRYAQLMKEYKDLGDVVKKGDEYQTLINNIEEAKEYFIESNTETHLEFPVLRYPEKVKSLNLGKTPDFRGVLKGIKGQYLIFEDQTVFNIRGSEGYYIGLDIN